MSPEEERRQQILNLNESPGYVDFQKPYIEDQIEERRHYILSKKCTSYEDYLASCDLVEKLDHILKNPERELDRIEDVIKRQGEKETATLRRMGEMTYGKDELMGPNE